MGEFASWSLNWPHVIIKKKGGGFCITTPPTHVQRCMIHMGHLRLALPTTHALAQTCVLLCPSIPIESSLSYPALLLARGSTTPPPLIY
jgi:hypothetical protein